MDVAILHHLEGDDEASWPTPRAYAEITEQVVAAEAMGYRSVWFAEHHFGATKGRLPSPLLFIAHAAARTSRIRLGPAVLLAPYYHPLRLAEEIATVDALSGGRLEAGIGSGSAPSDAAAFGVDLSEKHARLSDTLGLLRRAWRGEPVGENDLRVTPRPIQPWSDFVWVASSSHGAAAVAGQTGAHLLLPSLKTVEQSAAHADTYRRALLDAGHDPATRQIQVTLHVWLDPDRERARAEGMPIARAYASRYLASGIVPTIVGEREPDLMERINFVVGDADDLRAAVARRRDALGLTRIALQLRLGGMSHARTLQTMAGSIAALTGL